MHNMHDLLQEVRFENEITQVIIKIDIKKYSLLVWKSILCSDDFVYWEKFSNSETFDFFVLIDCFMFIGIFIFRYIFT